MANIKFTDTIEVTASHGRLAEAAQIYDDQQKATQAALNQKFAAIKSGTDFTAIYEEESPGGNESLSDLVSNKVQVGTIVRNTESSWTDGDITYPNNTLFLVIKDPSVNVSTWTEVLLPLIMSPDMIYAQFIDMSEKFSTISSRLEALEAKLKV